MKKQSFSYSTKQSAIASSLIISPSVKSEQGFQDYSTDSAMAALLDLDLTDCLDAIERRYGFQGDVAIFILSSALTPSLSDGDVKW
jgi:hypothetical protein